MRSAVRAMSTVALIAGLTGTAVQAQPVAQPPSQPAGQGLAPGLTVPAERGSAMFGRPAGNEASRLAPVDSPPLPTAAGNMPTTKLKAPDGFKIEVFATGIPDARSLRVGDKGTVFVGNRLLDKVYAIIPGANGAPNTVKVIASGLHRPNGLAFKDGNLYVAELNKIWRYDNIEANLQNPPKPVLIYDDLPADEAHGWKFIGIGPDNKLYVPIGAPGNILMPPPVSAQIRRMDLDGKNVEMVALGVRNSVGFDWNPVSKDFFFTNNGRDWLSEDIPEDTLHRVAANSTKAPHFGYPFCHQGNFSDPEYGWGKNCADFAQPAALLGAHVAALGMRFYTGSAFPAEYRNAIFMARHGSWNRTVKNGGDIAVVKLKDDGTVDSIKPFLTGFIQNNDYVGRPVDVQPMADGSLLVSDDWNGAVWRVSASR